MACIRQRAGGCGIMRSLCHQPKTPTNDSQVPSRGNWVGPLQCAMQCNLDRLLEGIERTGGEEKSMNREGRGNTENKKKKKRLGKLLSWREGRMACAWWCTRQARLRNVVGGVGIVAPSTTNSPSKYHPPPPCHRRDAATLLCLHAVTASSSARRRKKKACQRDK